LVSAADVVAHAGRRDVALVGDRAADRLAVPRVVIGAEHAELGVACGHAALQLPEAPLIHGAEGLDRAHVHSILVFARIGAMELPAAPFVLEIGVDLGDLRGYVAEIPAVVALADQPLGLHPHVTFLVGENGSGKSTLVEALAGAAGLDTRGGSALTRFLNRS